jgi:LacI family transcriptional regulator
MRQVIVDDFDSARNATQHLIDLGAKYCFDISSIDNLSG